MRIKYFLSAAVAIVSLVLPVTASAETVGDDNFQEISVTLSVEQFADLASDYGCSVTTGNAGVVDPQKHQTGQVEFTNNSFQHIGTDCVLINEEVQIQNISFSDNIDSVDVKIFIRTSTNPYETKGILNGGHSNTVRVIAGCQYKVYMRANSSVPLSETNKGTVSYYWTDRGWELI